MYMENANAGGGGADDSIYIRVIRVHRKMKFHLNIRSFVCTCSF